MILITGLYGPKCVRLGNRKQIRLVCFFNNTDSGNYRSYVTGSMASFRSIHSSDCNLHVVPGKNLPVMEHFMSGND